MEQDAALRPCCRVNTNADGDRFVGVKADADGVTVHFPIGYHLPDDEMERKRDILHLLQVLAALAPRAEMGPSRETRGAPETAFPLHAYLEIIHHFMESGYYRERDPVYRTGDRGAIDWAKTIRRQSALLQPDLTPVYTKYTVRRSMPNENKEISQIHKHCVCESFAKLGWLFTPYLPAKPGGVLDGKRALFILADRLQHTNNNKEKRLFGAMLDMLRHMDGQASGRQFDFGTECFEGVWERMIDKAFGIRNKQAYFPRTRWLLRQGRHKEKYPLEPDSIMAYEGKLYVLDAKYYRYGVSGNPNHLPDSSSINKQITYGEYLYRRQGMADENLFNAFLMPYDAAANPFGLDTPFAHVGMAVGDWKENTRNYEKIQGIVVDTRYLLYHHTGSAGGRIAALAASIEQAAAENTALLT